MTHGLGSSNTFRLYVHGNDGHFVGLCTELRAVIEGSSADEIIVKAGALIGSVTNRVKTREAAYYRPREPELAKGATRVTRLITQPYPHGAAEPETADEISVGQMYEYGESVPQDHWTALHWYRLAAATRDTAAAAGVQRVEQISICGISRSALDRRQACASYKHSFGKR